MAKGLNIIRYQIGSKMAQNVQKTSNRSKKRFFIKPMPIFSLQTRLLIYYILICTFPPHIFCSIQLLILDSSTSILTFLQLLNSSSNFLKNLPQCVGIKLNFAHCALQSRFYDYDDGGFTFGKNRPAAAKSTCYKRGRESSSLFQATHTG